MYRPLYASPPLRTHFPLCRSRRDGSGGGRCPRSASPAHRKIRAGRRRHGMARPVGAPGLRIAGRHCRNRPTHPKRSRYPDLHRHRGVVSRRGSGDTSAFATLSGPCGDPRNPFCGASHERRLPARSPRIYTGKIRFRQCHLEKRAHAGTCHCLSLRSAISRKKLRRRKRAHYCHDRPEKGRAQYLARNPRV